MPLAVRDGNGTAQSLKTSTDSGNLVPHHNIDTVVGPVPSSQSGSWSVSITGTLPAWTGASNLGKAEDSSHTSGDVGVMALAVRNDSGSVLANATGDYIPLTTDNTGALRVVGGGGGSQYAEDAVHTSGDLGTMAMTVRKDTAATTAGSDGDYASLITDANGRLHTIATLATGTNSIGKLGTANSGVVIGAVEQSGDWYVAQDTASVYSGSNKLTIKTKFTSLAAYPGTLVAAVPTKKIRVLSMTAGHTAAGTTSFTDGSGGTVMITVNHLANTTVVNAPSRGFICETTAGNGLFATATAGTASIWVQYIEV